MNDLEAVKQALGHKLLKWGMVLFLLALMTGLALPAMTNPRMGLSSHLEGVMNGMLLVLFGLMWPRLRLSERMLRIGFWLALFGTYVNWGTTFVAGLIGAGETLMPIASAGYRGSDVQEVLVAVGLVSLAVAILAASGIVLWGLRGSPTFRADPR